VIAAAGNEGDTSMSYPASYGSVMSVAAYESQATFSQRNEQVEISAPGYRVKSTWPPDVFPYLSYRDISGTSMATPHVAGVAAKLWSIFPNCTNIQIRNILVMTAKSLDGKNYSTRFGYGLLQANSAYDLLKSKGCEFADNFNNPLIDYDPTLTLTMSPSLSSTQRSASPTKEDLGTSSETATKNNTQSAAPSIITIPIVSILLLVFLMLQ